MVQSFFGNKKGMLDSLYFSTDVAQMVFKLILKLKESGIESLDAFESSKFYPLFKNISEDIIASDLISNFDTHFPNLKSLKDSISIGIDADSDVSPIKDMDLSDSIKFIEQVSKGIDWLKIRLSSLDTSQEFQNELFLPKIKDLKDSAYIAESKEDDTKIKQGRLH